VPSLSTRNASVFKSNKTNEIVVSVRGSDLVSKDTRLKDISTDIGIFAGFSRFGKRNKQIDRLVQKVKKQYPSNEITMTGHSLGARISSDVAKKHDLPAYVFNQGSSPSDIFSYIKDLIIKPKPNKVKHFTTGDVVSISAKALKPDEHIPVEPKADMNPHSLDNFIDESKDQVGVGKKKSLSKWNQHVKDYKKSHPNCTFKECLKGASKTYKK
jgi:hypothetical protein